MTTSDTYKSGTKESLASSREEPLRVAHVIGKMVHGGVESVVFNYYRHMDHSRIQFDFIYDEDSSASPPQDIVEQGGRFIPVPAYQTGPAFLRALKRVFSENEYKIVHSHLNTLSVFVLYAAKCAGVPVRIAHSHSTAGRGELAKNIVKNLLRPFSVLFATDFWACSEFAAKWLFGNRVQKSCKIMIIKNAIDLERFSFSRIYRDEVRNELGLKEKKVIGQIGRFSIQKNQEYTIDIFKRIHEIDSDTQLLLIGDGPLASRIMRKINDLNLMDAVTIKDSTEDIERYYSALDIMLFPSIYEGQGLVMIEAQSVGIPVVCSNYIPEESIIVSNNVKQISLNETAKWEEEVIRMLKEHKNYIDKSILRKAGYDICEQAVILEKKYISMANRIVKSDLINT